MSEAKKAKEVKPVTYQLIVPAPPPVPDEFWHLRYEVHWTDSEGQMLIAVHYDLHDAVVDLIKHGVADSFLNAVISHRQDNYIQFGSRYDDESQSWHSWPTWPPVLT